MNKAPNRIRELRNAAKLSQEQLGERIGAHKMTVSDLERGNVELTLTYMRRVATGLGVKPADLLSDDDEPDRLSDEERRLIASFREAGDQQRLMIQRIAEPVTGTRRTAA